MTQGGSRKHVNPRTVVGGNASPPVLRTAQVETGEPTNEISENIVAHVEKKSVDVAKEPEQYERSKIGHALRDDLVRDLKQIALDDSKKIYVVMEEAFEQYIREYSQSHLDFKPKSRIREI